MNAIAERQISSTRRECPDWILITAAVTKDQVSGYAHLMMTRR
jgi:hypothetical protein